MPVIDKVAQLVKCVEEQDQHIKELYLEIDRLKQVASNRERYSQKLSNDLARIRRRNVYLSVGISHFLDAYEVKYTTRNGIRKDAPLNIFIKQLAQTYQESLTLEEGEDDV